MKKNVRVAIRGTGLLGTRLMHEITRSEGLEVGPIIGKYDRTLIQMLSRPQIAPDIVVPKCVYLDEPRNRLADAQGAFPTIEFRPVGDLQLEGSCDVIIDAATGGRDHALVEQYQRFSGPVILQDGDYPRGAIIAPPIFTTPSGGNRFRQGGCFLSGVTPLVAPFHETLKELRLHLVMQSDEREADFMIAERIHSIRSAHHLIPRLQEELGNLFPMANADVLGIAQIPGLTHYLLTLELALSELPEDPAKLLAKAPRVRVLPTEITSTYELNLARQLTATIPPVAVLASTISCNSGTDIILRFCAVLYYRTLAVLPNIDAIRVLVQGMDPLEAMSLTDSEHGF